MPQLPVTVNAPPPWVAADATLTVPWEMLLKRAVTAGRLLDPTAPFPWAPGVAPRLVVFDALHRAGAVAAYMSGAAGLFVKSGMYTSLERSEKAVASYFTGMAAAAVFADHHLAIPQLVHLDRVQQALAFAGRRRPDLLGYHDTHGWVVVEAKGRSSGAGYDADDAMREQKAAVTIVGGAAPVARFGVMAAYTATAGPDVMGLALRVIDPPEPVRLRTTPDEALAAYYGPLVVLTNALPAPEWLDFEAGTGMAWAELYGCDAALGLDLRLAALVQGLTESADGFRSAVKSLEMDGDGVLVQLRQPWSNVGDSGAERLR